MPRHPDDIVPINGTEELLHACYGVLVEIRDRLAPPPDQGEAPATADAAVTEAAKPAEPPLVSTKPASKKPARKKPAPRKKPA